MKVRVTVEILNEDATPVATASVMDTSAADDGDPKIAVGVDVPELLARLLEVWSQAGHSKELFVANLASRTMSPTSNFGAVAQAYSKWGKRKQADGVSFDDAYEVAVRKREGRYKAGRATRGRAATR